MKTQIRLSVIIIALLLLVPCAFSQRGGPNPLDTNALAKLKNALKQDGLDVRSGKVDVWNLAEQWCAGDPNVDSALYLNIEPYHQLKLPKSTQYPDQLTTDFLLQPDEAIVLIGLTPPTVRYFSYTPYLASRVYPNRRQTVFASLGDAVNNSTIKTLGPTPFSTPVVLIFTPDQRTDARIRAALYRAGYPAAIINTVVFPSSMLNLGYGMNADELRIVARTAMWDDPNARDDYMYNPPLQIFRVSPVAPTVLNPFPAPPLRVRGTGRSEMYLMNKLGELRQAIIGAYQSQGLHATDIQARPNGYEGYDYIQRGLDQPCVISQGTVICGPPIPDGQLGDIRDAFYLAAGWLPETNYTDKLTLDDDEFLVVYGPNHVATGKATYMNIGFYASETAKLSIGTLNDLYFPGSAKPYLTAGDPAAEMLYAYKVSRSCWEGEPYCLPLKAPANCARLTVDRSTLLGIFERIYLEPATKVGPALPEILFDRVIKFSPRQ